MDLLMMMSGTIEEERITLFSSKVTLTYKLGINFNYYPRS